MPKLFKNQVLDCFDYVLYILSKTPDIEQKALPQLFNYIKVDLYL